MKSKYEMVKVAGRNITKNSADFLMELILQCSHADDRVKSKIVDVLWYFDVKSHEQPRQNAWTFTGEYLDASGILLDIEIRIPQDKDFIVFTIITVRFPTDEILTVDNTPLSFNFGTPNILFYSDPFSKSQSWENIGTTIREAITVAREYLAKE